MFKFGINIKEILLQIDFKKKKLLKMLNNDKKIYI